MRKSKTKRIVNAVPSKEHYLGLSIQFGKPGTSDLPVCLDPVPMFLEWHGPYLVVLGGIINQVAEA